MSALVTWGPRFPWALLCHWLRRYWVLWLLLALVLFAVQGVLAAVLHEREDVRNLITGLDRLPRIFRALIGGDELMPTNILSVVAIGYQHPLTLTLLMVNAVAVPSGLITAQCEQGTMEILLARPVTRTQIYLVTALLALGSETLLAAVVLAGTGLWTRVFDFGEPVPLAGFACVAVNLAALGGAVTGLSMLAAVSFAERSRVIAWVVGYLVASYLLEFSVVWLPRLEVFHPVTLFNYFRPNQVLKAASLPCPFLAVLGAVGAAGLILGWWIWRRRDLYAA